MLAVLLPLLLSQPALARKVKEPPPPASAAPSAETGVSATPTVPRFSRTDVPGCGCALYTPAGFAFEAPTKSEDASDVWTGDSTVDSWHFGAVVVKFAGPAEGADEELEALLIGYLDFLKTQLSVVKSAGVGRGHTQEAYPKARGVIDYWEDKDGDSWAVKGWVDANRLAVLFVYGKGDYPIPNAQQMFLDGFRFP